MTDRTGHGDTEDTMTEDTMTDTGWTPWTDDGAWIDDTDTDTVTNGGRVVHCHGHPLPVPAIGHGPSDGCPDCGSVYETTDNTAGGQSTRPVDDGDDGLEAIRSGDTVDMSCTACGHVVSIVATSVHDIADMSVTLSDGPCPSCRGSVTWTTRHDDGRRRYRWTDDTTEDDMTDTDTVADTHYLLADDVGSVVAWWPMTEDNAETDARRMATATGHVLHTGRWTGRMFTVTDTEDRR